MRIAQLASLAESVPPTGYGGTELVVSLLTEELAKQGNYVTLFASGDSNTAARHISIVDRSLRKHPEIPQTRWPAYDIRSILRLKKMAGEFDIVHNHMGWQALPLLHDLDCPVVTTNHNPVKDYCKEIYFAYNDMNFVSISNAYRSLNYPDDLNYVATVYNGIDLDKYGFHPNDERDGLLFIGRLCHDKGTREAIEIAQALGLPIKIAGKVDVRDASYFEAEIKPLLDDSRVEFVGEVDESQKRILYQKAVAVVYPINFEEPFGLVMAESLASGTPVMAFDRGSVREVLSDGETAVIAGTKDELIERFPEIEKIKPQTCRNRVAKLFSKEEMTKAYEALYRRLMSRRK